MCVVVGAFAENNVKNAVETVMRQPWGMILLLQRSLLGWGAETSCSFPDWESSVIERCVFTSRSRMGGGQWWWWQRKREWWEEGGTEGEEWPRGRVGTPSVLTCGSSSFTEPVQPQDVLDIRYHLWGGGNKDASWKNACKQWHFPFLRFVKRSHVSFYCSTKPMRKKGLRMRFPILEGPAFHLVFS